MIVEGYVDCIKLWQHGVKRLVAIMGSSLSPAQEAWVRKQTDSQSQVIVMPAEDEAGLAGREDIAVRLCKFVFVKERVRVLDGDGFSLDRFVFRSFQRSLQLSFFGFLDGHECIPFQFKLASLLVRKKV